MDHTIHAYEPARDLDAVVRIWKEVGWLDDPDQKSSFGAFLEAANTEVALMDGEAECMVHWTPGSITYQQTDLPLCAITAVTTSHIGRKLGFASAMTVNALEQGAAAGAAVAALGMFEQGFYDRFGFGTAAYENELSFDPASLQVAHVPYEPPVRLTPDDFGDMHRAMRGRMRSHGAVNLDPAETTEFNAGTIDNGFGLGYRDESGRLTHFLYGSMSSWHGPWHLRLLAYENTAQLLALFRLLKELGDQVRTVKLIEPPHIQLQALLREPMRERDRTLTTKHQTENRSLAWWQLRILDLDACVAARQWPGPDLSFNLALSDPLTERLSGDWPGVAGDYTVTVGATSKLEPGHTVGLPTLTAGVGAFTRLWFGVRQATTLAVTDALDAPTGLLESLDQALLLPRPLPGRDF